MIRLLIVALLLTSCSGGKSPKSDSLQSVMMLNYSQPELQRSFRPLPAGVPVNINQGRIGIVKIEDGRIAELNLRGNMVPWRADMPRVIYNGTNLEDHNTQIEAWNRLAGQASNAQFIYLPKPTLNYPNGPFSAIFSTTWSHLQAAMVEQNLDTLIIYQSSMLRNTDPTALGRAQEALVDNLPKVAVYPVGFLVVASTSMLPISSRSNVAYVDGIVISRREGTYQTYRAIADPVERAGSVIGMVIEKRHKANSDPYDSNRMKPEVEASNQAFMRFFQALTTSN